MTGREDSKDKGAIWAFESLITGLSFSAGWNASWYNHLENSLAQSLEGEGPWSLRSSLSTPFYSCICYRNSRAHTIGRL